MYIDPCVPLTAYWVNCPCFHLNVYCFCYCGVLTYLTVSEAQQPPIVQRSVSIPCTRMRPSPSGGREWLDRLWRVLSRPPSSLRRLWLNFLLLSRPRRTPPFLTVAPSVLSAVSFAPFSLYPFFASPHPTPSCLRLPSHELFPALRFPPPFLFRSCLLVYSLARLSPLLHRNRRS